MNQSEDVSNPRRGTPHFFKLPESIQNYSAEQIEEFAAGVIRQFLVNPILGRNFIDRKYLDRFYDAFGENPAYWPSTIQLADMLTTFFPGSNLTVRIDKTDFELLLSFQGKLLASLNDQHIEFTTGEPTHSWAGSLEGDVFTVGRLYLQHFADIGYIVYKPSRPLEFGVIPTTLEILQPTEKEI